MQFCLPRPWNLEIRMGTLTFDQDFALCAWRLLRIMCRVCSVSARNAAAQELLRELLDCPTKLGNFVAWCRAHRRPPIPNYSRRDGKAPPIDFRSVLGLRKQANALVVARKFTFLRCTRIFFCPKTKGTPAYSSTRKKPNGFEYRFATCKNSMTSTLRSPVSHLERNE